jgi:hypothetical protein
MREYLFPTVSCARPLNNFDEILYWGGAYILKVVVRRLFWATGRYTIIHNLNKLQFYLIPQNTVHRINV